jgi:hypothetical protein
MKNEYTIEEIRSLESELNLNPSDTNLMNKLAIAYLNVPDAGGWNDIDELFRKAHSLTPGIKTANNYAYQMICDWNECKKGIDLLEPFIESSPKSYMPYNLIGYAYLLVNRAEEAEYYFQKSSDLANAFISEIVHNLAVSKSYLGKIQEAVDLNKIVIGNEDLNNQALFNLGVNYAKVKEHRKVDKLIKELIVSEEYTNNNVWVSNIELSQLSYSNGNLELAYELIKNESNFWISSFPEFAYILNKFDKPKFNELIDKEIKMETEWLDELKNPDEEELLESTSEEREEESKQRLKNISRLEKLEDELRIAPKLEIRELYQIGHCGCMLYDCKVHETMFDE